MHSARQVANFLLKETRKSGKGLSPLQVLKLVYISHGFMLGDYEQPLVADRIEAWEYGPVVPDLYHQVKHYGNAPITGRIEEDIGSAPFSEKEENVMRGVIDSHKHIGGIALSSMTHQKGTPWDMVWQTFGKNAIIPDCEIGKYYKTLINSEIKNA